MSRKYFCFFFQIVLYFVEHNDKSMPADALLIKRWWDTASRKRCENKNQSKISDIFMKK